MATATVLRISILWLVVLIGLIYHTLLHLVPIFYGVDIVKEGANGQMPTNMVLIFGFTFLVPILAVMSVNFINKQMAWIVNLVLSGFALLVNVGHLSELFIATEKNPVQFFVLIPLAFVAFVLLIESWKLKKNRE